jgi:hypothetical protein
MMGYKQIILSAYKTTLKKVMLLFCICFFYSCKNENDPTKFKVFENDTTTGICKKCNDVGYIISPIATDSKRIISSPIVIEFFQVYNFSILANSEKSNPIVEKSKRIDRQLYYRLIEQNSVYKALLKPKIDSLHIKTITGNYDDSILTFDVNNINYSINVASLKKTDGVLLYKPSKKPILWRFDGNRELSIEYNFVECYFEK